ncbi:MAG: histidine kinase dimerization/phospho-acceptor domain-containing protein [Acidimicrobiales bacterium]
MRRRIILATVTVAVVGIVVFGLPLAMVARRVVRDDELRRLDREADAVAFAVDDDDKAGRAVDPGTIRAVLRPDRLVVVTDPASRRTTVGEPVSGRTIAAEVRTSSGFTVRLQAPGHHADERTLGAVAFVAGLAAVGVAVAVALAVVVARRLVRPLSGLAAASARIGAGDFSVRADRCGIAEADAVADALNATASRIDELLDAERSFSANASHQLRTPLTAIGLHLEELVASADPEVRRVAATALAEAHRLEHTIEDLLAFARRGRIGPRQDVDIARLVAERAPSWQQQAAAAGRHVVVRSEPGCWALASKPTVAQSLDALVENSLRHGAGAVTVSARVRRGYAEIVVADQGRGIPAGSEVRIFERHLSLGGGSGVGLALARALIQSDGGRLDLLERRPPAFRILLPSP